MNVIFLLSATLVVSMGGLVALLALKRYEMTTGRVVFRQIRPQLGMFFHACLVWVEQALPALLAHAIRRGVGALNRVIHQVVARGILALEHALVWVLKTLHYTTQPTSSGTGEVSAFLREVAEHKKKLLKRNQK